MLKTDPGRASAAAAAGLSETYLPFEVIEGALDSGYLLLCDHASNHIPPEYHSLGLPARELERHIAYDIGAAALTRCLARKLGAPAVLSRFSRLLIDPNRGEDDPTLVMRLSDGAVVPGNARIDEAEKSRRIERFYRPYDEAVGAAVRHSIEGGVPAAIVSIHSFTPFWRGTRRPWEAGVLWDSDPRLALPIIDALRADTDLTVGDNEPYSGRLKGDMMWRHGTRGGLAHALIEIRQDLIADAAGVTEWCHRLGDVLKAVARRPGLNEIVRTSPSPASL